MKKIFLFVAALCTGAMMSATTYTLEPGVDQIKGIKESLADGDTLLFKTGEYKENTGKMIFTTKLTLMAAEDQTPELKVYDFRWANDFEANGITFTNLSTDNYLVRSNAAAENVSFKNCTFNNQAPTPHIYLSSNAVTNLIIDNCFFGPTTKSEGAAVYGCSTAVTNFTLTNSTFVGCGGTDLAVYMKDLTTAVVDHCTFYGCGARVLYLPSETTLDSCAVSNCIVANDTLVAQYCVATYAGTVDNVLYYNTNAPRSSNATVNGCINEDPLFVNAAEGDFTLAEGSPAIGAATDGSNLGDPRWTPKEPELEELTENFTLDFSEAYGLNEQTSVLVNENILTVTANAEAWAAGGANIPFPGYVKTANFSGFKASVKTVAGGSVELCPYVIDKNGFRWYQTSLDASDCTDWVAVKHDQVPFGDLWTGGTADDWANAELVIFGVYGACGTGLTDYVIEVKEVEILVGEQPSALSEVNTSVKPVKTFVNGQVVIERNGVRFNVLGTEL